MSPRLRSSDHVGLTADRETVVQSETQTGNLVLAQARARFDG